VVGGSGKRGKSGKRLGKRKGREMFLMGRGRGSKKVEKGRRSKYTYMKRERSIKLKKW
jgi:hypothetical protein